MVHLFFPEGVNMGFPVKDLLSLGSRKVLSKEATVKVYIEFSSVYQSRANLH